MGSCSVDLDDSATSARDPSNPAASPSPIKAEDISMEAGGISPVEATRGEGSIPEGTPVARALLDWPHSSSQSPLLPGGPGHGTLTPNVESTVPCFGDGAIASPSRPKSEISGFADGDLASEAEERGDGAPAASSQPPQCEAEGGEDAGRDESPAACQQLSSCDWEGGEDPSCGGLPSASQQLPQWELEREGHAGSRKSPATTSRPQQHSLGKGEAQESAGKPRGPADDQVEASPVDPSPGVPEEGQSRSGGVGRGAVEEDCRSRGEGSSGSEGQQRRQDVGLMGDVVAVLEEAGTCNAEVQPESEPQIIPDSEQYGTEADLQLGSSQLGKDIGPDDGLIPDSELVRYLPPWPTISQSCQSTMLESQTFLCLVSHPVRNILVASIL